MAPRIRWTFRSTLLLGLSLGLLLFTNAVWATEATERRVSVGFKFFVSTVRADQELATKLNAQGRQELWILYDKKRLYAESFAQQLKGEPAYSLRAVSFRELAQEPEPPPTAMFLVEPAPDRRQVIDYGIKHHRLVFSPFGGDVPKGFPVGIVVREYIGPLVNLDTLKRAGIRLRPFFLEAAATSE